VSPGVAEFVPGVGVGVINGATLIGVRVTPI
jgi:hypothetical protein